MEGEKISVTGIAASSLLSYLTQHLQSKKQQFHQELQQLGQDLKSGNISPSPPSLRNQR